MHRIASPILALALLLTACNGGEPLKVTRSPCPAVGVPAYANDITLFNPAESYDATAIDVVALITKVRGGCSDNGSRFVTNATFEVQARRSEAGAARTVTLPYFAAVVRSGNQLVAKQIGTVRLDFPAGQLRTSATVSSQSQVDRAAATLSPAIERKLTKNRKPGEEDAAIDPMSLPDVRDAVQSASFELLVGFQLDERQLAYNATK